MESEKVLTTQLTNPFIKTLSKNQKIDLTKGSVEASKHLNRLFVLTPLNKVFVSDGLWIYFNCP